MTSAFRSRWQVALRIGLFGALTSVGVGCRTLVHYVNVYPKNLQGFQLPPGCPIGGPTNTAQLNACLTGIQFDTVEFVGDEQRLMVRQPGPGTGAPCFGDPTHTCRYGPLAKVEPVKGSELYSNAVLAQGRIIARIYLRPLETESYPKFGLAPGDTTYWWVKVNTVQDTSLFVRRTSGVSALAITGRPLTRTPHAAGSFQQAFAQWVWDPVDETLNGGCGSACCKPK